ncbi:MAG: acylphosphatase [Proteobacteria bacterium]|nr:acylphosphatase [Pseudomonadota bacterium]
MKSLDCKRCRVSGRVQGVYYRGSAQALARELGIVGHARNLADGSVEVLACGEATALSRFLDWLWVGPVSAVVASVEVFDHAAETLPADFLTG